jgi:hypothetical protein
MNVLRLATQGAFPAYIVQSTRRFVPDSIMDRCTFIDGDAGGLSRPPRGRTTDVRVRCERVAREAK